jgi:hypothetical protein
MGRVWGVLVLLIASLCVPTAVRAQVEGERGKFRLAQNHQDPFSHRTRIQFELDAELFESHRLVYVTLRVKDLLGRPVATPVAKDHEAGEPPVDELEYTTPGSKEAVWDGTDRMGRKVPPAAYLLELVVNGERAPPVRMVVVQ